MYICTYFNSTECTYVHTSTLLNVHTYVHASTLLNVHTYILQLDLMYIRTCFNSTECTYVYTSTLLNMHKYVHAFIRTLVCMYVGICLCTIQVHCLHYSAYIAVVNIVHMQCINPCPTYMRTYVHSALICIVLCSITFGRLHLLCFLPEGDVSYIGHLLTFQ